MEWNLTNEETRKYPVELEDLTFHCNHIQGDGLEYTLTGAAVIDGETYNNFQIAIGLSRELQEKTPEQILDGEWDWYDYVF